MEWADPEPLRPPVVAKPKGTYEREDQEKAGGRKLKKGKKRKR